MSIQSGETISNDGAKAGSVPARARYERARRLRTEANAAMFAVTALLIWVPHLSTLLGLPAESIDAQVADTFEHIACMVITWFAVYRIAHYTKQTRGSYAHCLAMLEPWAALLISGLVVYSVVKP